MTRPGLGEGDRGASPVADSQDVPRYEHEEVNQHYPTQSNDGQGPLPAMPAVLGPPTSITEGYRSRTLEEVNAARMRRATALYAV
jgi:hypothetical protein